MALDSLASAVINVMALWKRRHVPSPVYKYSRRPLVLPRIVSLFFPRGVQSASRHSFTTFYYHLFLFFRLFSYQGYSIPNKHPNHRPRFPPTKIIMRSEQLLIVLLVAVTTAHPVPKPRGGDHVSREVQYSDIVAAYSSTAAEAHTGAHDRRELQYSDIVAVSGPLAPTPHGDAGVRRELEYSEIVALTGPPGKWQHASRHSGHGHHGPSGGSLLSSLMHETRSDIAGRVLEGIKHFLSHVVRDAPEVRNKHLAVPSRCAGLDCGS